MDKVLENEKILENKSMTEEEYCRAMKGLLDVISLFEAFGALDAGNACTVDTAEWFRFKISFAITCVRDFSSKERFDIFNEWMTKIRDTMVAMRTQEKIVPMGDDEEFVVTEQGEGYKRGYIAKKGARNEATA